MNQEGQDNSIDRSPMIGRMLNVCLRIVLTGVVWSLIGVLIGANNGRIQDCDTVRFVSQIIAWSIMMGFMGGMLGILGSPIRFVCFVALLGGMIGLTADWSAGHAGPHAQTNHFLLLGAIVGTTIGPWLKMYVFTAKTVGSALHRVAFRSTAASDSI